MSKDYISNKREFRNFMLGVAKELYDKINFTPMDKDENDVYNLYIEFSKFVEDKCAIDSPAFIRSSFEYKGKTYPTIEISNFLTADDCTVYSGIFTDEEFMDLNDDSLEYRMLDEKIYGYLPRKFIEKGTEQEVREYIKWNIG